MRLVETCSCGASIEISWSEPKGYYSHQEQRESERARKEIASFRKAHKTCLVSKAASS